MRGYWAGALIAVYLISRCHLMGAAHPAPEGHSQKRIYVVVMKGNSAAEEHRRLAAFYSEDADRALASLQYADRLMMHWGNVEGMANWSKVPNAFTHARALSDVYRARWKLDKRLASYHLAEAEMLEGASK